MNSVLSISFNTPDCLIVTIGTVCENQDTSLIGNTATDMDGTGMKISEASKRPHFRRGHIRMQRYGDKLGKSKIVFIAPTFINRTSLGEEVQPKNYIVK